MPWNEGPPIMKWRAVSLVKIHKELHLDQPS